jgi:hypothetical protein
MNQYILGLLYGDGHFQIKEGRELFVFATTHKEIAEKIETLLKENEFKYAHYKRDFPSEHEKGKWEVLELIEVYDINFHKILKGNGYNSNSVEDRIKWSGDFLRGYLETKGTFFKYEQRGNEAWRVSFSGKKDDIEFIRDNLEKMNISCSKVVVRKEREDLGVKSESYRVSIQNRGGIDTFVKFINCGDMSLLLKERINGFTHFNSTKPFNMKSVFKNYKYAVLFMARKLNLEIKGVRGGGGTKGFKPVYLWEDEEQILCFRGWEGAYGWIKDIFYDETGFNPPLVEEEK